ncbi:MAG TPA: SPOR domain-containing protein [Gammaproteobacteria bacterium]|nr:SPOR domain-containing protein [Gammaproteobacteria bacterium]
MDQEEEGLSADDELLELDASDLGLDEEEEATGSEEASAPETQTSDAESPEEDLTDLEAFLEDFEQQQMQEAAAGLQDDESGSPDQGDPESVSPVDEGSAWNEAADLEDALEDLAAVSDEQEATGEEEAGEPEAAAETETEEALPAEEFDLSFGEEEQEETAGTEPEAQAGTEPEAQEEVSAAPEPAEAATASAAAAAASETPQPPPTSAPEVPLASEEPVRKESNRGLIAAVVLVVVALAAAIGSGVLTYTLEQRVASLAATVQSLQGSRGAAANPGLEGQVRQLTDRVQELATIVEGPMGHLNEARQQGIEQLDVRVEELSGRLSGLQEKVAAVRQRVGRLAEAGNAAATERGAWSVNLASFKNEGAADQALGELRASGVTAEKQRVVADGRTWYRLRVTGFESKQAAEAYGRKVEADTGMTDTWVSKG